MKCVIYLFDFIHLYNNQAQAIVPNFGQSSTDSNKKSKNFLVNGYMSVKNNIVETMLANWCCWPSK